MLECMLASAKLETFCICREYNPRSGRRRISVEHATIQARPTQTTHDVTSNSKSSMKHSLPLHTIEGIVYLIVVDLYSDVWEIENVDNTTLSTIIQKCNAIAIDKVFQTSLFQTMRYSRHPYFSPRFSSAAFIEFNKWSFRHITSSCNIHDRIARPSQRWEWPKLCLKSTKWITLTFGKGILYWQDTPTACRQQSSSKTDVTANTHSASNCVRSSVTTRNHRSARQARINASSSQKAVQPWNKNLT